jgi:hypothetical protein
MEVVMEQVLEPVAVQAWVLALLPLAQLEEAPLQAASLVYALPQPHHQ